MHNFDSLSNSIMQATTELFALQAQDLEILQEWLLIRNVELFFKNIDHPIDVNNPEDIKLAAAFKLLVNNYDRDSGQILWRKPAKIARDILIALGINGIVIKGLVQNLVYAQEGTATSVSGGTQGQGILPPRR